MMETNATESPATVLVGVTGGIAAYKAAEIVRSLVKEGLDVHVVMSRNAQEFITPLTLQVLSNNLVWTETFHLTREQEIGHIAIVDRSSLFLIAPATANVLGKVAAGVADDLLTTMVCAAANRIPVLFAPSMNVNMYQNRITQENIEKLKRFGYSFIEPAEGEPEEIEPPRGFEIDDTYRSQLEDFMGGVAGGESELATIEEAVEVVRIAEELGVR